MERKLTISKEDLTNGVKGQRILSARTKMNKDINLIDLEHQLTRAKEEDRLKTARVLGFD